MFGSQALETAIGLALLFFVLASGASAIVEALSSVLQKRAKNLEATIRDMLTGQPGTPATDPAAAQAFELFRGTTIYTAGQGAAQQARWIVSSKARPTYLSARSFADAIVELLASKQLQDVPLPGWQGLSKRLDVLTTEANQDLLHVKAGLESWFDETMSRLADAYKRWATAVLFVVGLAIASLANVSTIDVAQTLWQQPAVQQAALSAAEQEAAKGTLSKTFVPDNVKSVEAIGDLGLPIGWPTPPMWTDPGWLWPHIGGWLITALLLMLGAPFWFDALSRLVSLGTSGVKPPPATQDDASATSIQATASPQDSSAASQALLDSITTQRGSAKRVADPATRKTGGADGQDISGGPTNNLGDDHNVPETDSPPP